MPAHADLWGEIAPSAIRTPVSILREQASLLGAKTNHVIEGKVESYVSENKFYHSFKFVVPALDNYSYELFLISHGFNPYPVRPRADLASDLQDEGAFLNWLARKLSASETKSIIGNLLAQANS